jgi:hypothetical protein
VTGAGVTGAVAGGPLTAADRWSGARRRPPYVLRVPVRSRGDMYLRIGSSCGGLGGTTGGAEGSKGLKIGSSSGCGDAAGGRRGTEVPAPNSEPVVSAGGAPPNGPVAAGGGALKAPVADDCDVPPNEPVAPAGGAVNEPVVGDCDVPPNEPVAPAGGAVKEPVVVAGGGAPKEPPGSSRGGGGTAADAPKPPFGSS